jgi:hypothetical protein
MFTIVGSPESTERALMLLYSQLESEKERRKSLELSRALSSQLLTVQVSTKVETLLRPPKQCRLFPLRPPLPLRPSYQLPFPLFPSQVVESTCQALVTAVARLYIRFSAVEGI